MCTNIDKYLCGIDNILFLSGDYQLANRLELIGKNVHNSGEVIRLCANKVDTYVELLKDKTIPQPKTIPAPFIRDIHSYEKLYLELIKELGDKFIIKSVYLITSYKEYIKVVSDNINKQLLFQEFIETSFGKDIRVVYAFGEIIACMLRQSNNDFRSNFSRGGQVYYKEITDEIISITKKVSNILGGSILGIDLLLTENGYTVCEVNTNPGMEGISMANDRNIPLDIVEKII